tara:strand:+ start:234 stop:545 length:312 start_codon:yes stop_codon:yes gene_type:complete
MSWKNNIRKEEPRFPDFVGREESPLNERAGLADNEGREIEPTDGDKEIHDYLNKLLDELKEEMLDLPVRYAEDSDFLEKAINHIERAIHDIQRAKKLVRRRMR